jgi:hypothetical protein
MAEILNKIKFINKKSIFLFFGEKDYYINQNLIKNYIPTQNYIKKLYKKIMEINKNEISLSSFCQIENYKEMIKNKKLLNTSLKIFEELGLLKYNKSKLKLVSDFKSELDLSNSISYNKTIKQIQEFNKFSKFAFTDNIFIFLKQLEKFVG